MTNEEWLEWMDDLNFNLGFIRVKVTASNNKKVEMNLSEASMKDGLPYIIMWARKKVHEELLKKELEEKSKKDKST